MSSRAPISATQKDPWDWCAVIAVFFLALAWHRLGMPSRIYFDEVHYVKAARLLLELKQNNPEHPPLGKEIIAAGIWLLGDKPIYWRIPSAIAGAIGLFAFARAMWFVSGSRFATLAGQFLLATGFTWFVQSRIAMLDMFMACSAMLAFWMFAAAVARPEQGRLRLAACGLFIGLALAAKWSIAPIAVLPGLLFLALKLRDTGKGFLLARHGGPVPGISLIEAALWLGALPLAIYWASFLPNFLYLDKPVSPLGFVKHHRWMLDLQDSVRKLHPYRSYWYQWVTDWRPMWYLYEKTDGAQRGILLLGNPFSMLAGLLALVWCLWSGIREANRPALLMAVLYLASMLFWVFNTKPIQFYYHYLMPGAFLMGGLALALDALYRQGGKARWLAYGALALSAGMFAWFYPILSAAQLQGPGAFHKWMWLKSWI